jgi:DNA/RNA endonuclease YhcR with UshA esterase domain
VALISKGFVMRGYSSVLVCLLVSLPCVVAADEGGPAEAAGKVNEQVTVEMEVKSATLRGSICFLNSEEEFKNPKNFTLFIDKDALAKFKEAKVDDPAAHFKGKIVRAVGKVVLYQKRPEIKLSGPDDIKIVEKK